MTKTVLAFGETLWDLFPTGAKLGGAPFNFVYRAACLGERGIMVSRLGRDALGRKAFEQIVSLGMETGQVQWDARHPTGTVDVTFDAGHNPHYVINPDVAYDYIRPTKELLAAAAGADCICFGTLAQRCEVSRRALRRLLDAAGGALKLLDINLRPNCYTQETVRESLEEADILKLNETEAVQLAELLQIPGAASCGGARPPAEIAEDLVEKCSLSCCVVTLGDRGALAVAADGRKAYVPGFRVALVDPCGSGDAFTAGFLHRYFEGARLSECCRYGNALGAIVAAQRGATEPFDAAGVQKFLESGVERTGAPDMESITFP